jgi:hypothetical protein
MKLPTRQDHETFVDVEGWQQVRNARGGTGGHHATYELGLPDGRLLRTRISHPPNRTTYGPQLWSHILRDQLEVGNDEFWDCVQNKVLPDRGTAPTAANAVPAQVVHQLIHSVGVPETDVARMSRQEAIQRLQQYWSGLG